MKKLQYTTNDPSASTDYLAADNTWKTIPGGGGGSGIPKGTTSGTDTYTTTISGVTAYNDGDAYLIRFSIGNTTQCTLNINSLGAKDLYRNNNGLLVGGDIIDGAEMFCIYNSTLNGFQVIGTAPNTLLAYVTNADSVTITKGQPVYAFGGTGDRLTVKLASNSTDATSAQTVGLVLSSSIATNQKGLIIVNGQLDGLNIFPTSTWADGDAVYLGATAGTVTKTKPSAPNHLVYLGFVTTANNGSAGRMYVRVQNGYELDEIHDVKITSVANNDTLQYNSTSGLWENKVGLSVNAPTGSGADKVGLIVSGSNTNGGTSYIDFLKATNTASGATNINKYFRLNSTGQLEVVNSAYTSTILTLTDAGVLNGATQTEMSYLSGVTSSIQTQINSKISTSKSFLGTLIGFTMTAGQTVYGCFTYNTINTSELARVFVCPNACTVSNFYVRLFTAQPASGSIVYTVRKNFVDTSVVVTIAAGSAANTEANSGATSATFSAGDDMTFKVVNNATTTSANTHNFSIMIEI